MAHGSVTDPTTRWGPMSWPWTTTRDPVTGERAALSWSSWSLHLGSVFQAPDPQQLALAITLLVDSGPDEPQRLARALAILDELGLARADVSLVLLDARVVAPPTSTGADDHRFESDAEPAKLAIVWGLCALASGRAAQPWMLFAAASAELLAMFQGLSDLLDDAVDVGCPPPRVAALLRACRAERSASDCMLDACAGALDHPDRLLALRVAATNPAVLAQVTASRERLFAGARAALPELRAEPGEAFLSALLDGFSQLDGALWMRGVMARAATATAPARSSARVSTNAAVDYLEHTRPWVGAWDVHRFHPMGAPCVLVGRWFIEAMILLALAEVGREDPSVEIAKLFDRVPEGEARYFPEWSGLPPDCDSLGLLLQLATWLPTSQRGRVDSWIAPCEASLGPDESVPTWFVNGPNGRTTPLPGPFLGDECTGTTLAFLLGALRYDGERFASLFRPNLQRVLERGCEAGSVHYTRDFALHLLLRLVHALRSHPSPRLAALPGELDLDRLAIDRCAALLARQRIDGGWGSPQATALALEALSHWHSGSPCIARAITYLVHTQGPDGAWPAEPLYITPGKFGGMVPFSAKALTTALCVRALHVAQIS
jgi:hypothetical protein